MAKILMTAIVADIRNKLNGSVFSKNKAGAYIRTKVTPVNPQTTAQQNQRNILSTWSQGWRGLTFAQRSGWNSAAVNFPYTDIFGNIKQLSGFQLYCKLNINLNVAGVAGIDDAPSPVDIPAITDLGVTGDTSTPSYGITFTSTPIPADFAMVIDVVANVGTGKTFVKNLYRNVYVAVAAATSPIDLTSYVTGKFGSPVTGLQVFARARLISTISGQSGVPIQAQAVITA